jgi:hypothetical protein
MRKRDMESKLLSTKETAAKFGVPFKVIQKLAGEGRISCYKFSGDARKKKRGAKMFFREKEVRKYFQEHREASVYELLHSLHSKVEAIERYLKNKRRAKQCIG